MTEARNSYRILMEESEGNRSLGRQKESLRIILGRTCVIEMGCDDIN
jgi:hypothetical protein